VPRAADPPVGERIREERTKRGVSLRSLARGVGVSASLISQIETGKCQPSVSTLYAITTTLGISVEDVFQPAGAAPGAPADAAAPAPVPGASSLGAAPLAAQHPPGAPAAVLAAARSYGAVGRRDEREVLRLDSGVTWERLGHVPGFHADFLLVTYAPGGSSSGTGQFMRHTGAEYGYLMEGELILTLGAEEHRLTAGQSVSFPSSTPHRYRNDGARPAVGVWFVSGENGGVFSIH
jgi:transcriptional regulator with XRE-family HTH domain